VSAGLPGLGLGGLFFVLAALLAPFPELWRTLRGRGSRAAWRAIGRQLAQALAMIAAIAACFRLPLTMFGLTAVLLAAVVGGAKAAQLVGPDKRRRFTFSIRWLPSSSPSRVPPPAVAKSPLRESSISR
jgi:hypothetical protein